LAEVPAAAILFKPHGLQVAVVDENSKITFRDIKVAKDDGDTVEISDGVKPGERVAVNINSDIVAGQEVAVANESGTKSDSRFAAPVAQLSK
jgi:hypothetical protein